MCPRKLDTTGLWLGGFRNKLLWNLTLDGWNLQAKLKNDGEKTIQSLHGRLSSGPSIRFWMVDGNWQFSPWPHSEERKVYESWLPRLVCLIMCVSFSSLFIVMSDCPVFCVCGSSKKSICSTSVASYFAKLPHSICTSYIHFIDFGYVWCMSVFLCQAEWLRSWKYFFKLVNRVPLQSIICAFASAHSSFWWLSTFAIFMIDFLFLFFISNHAQIHFAIQTFAIQTLFKVSYK